MKELSIEEKAIRYDGNYKAYAEIINRLENVKDAIKKQNYGIAMDILCKPYQDFQVTTHSELKESEGERIRKALLRFHKSTIDIDGIKGEDILAWLEKQGKNNMGISEATKQKLEDNLNEALEKETPESWNKFLDKQGEQKLVNTDLDELVIQLEETIGTSPHSRETIKDFFQRAVQKYINCLNIASREIENLVEENYRLKEKQGEQKPQRMVSAEAKEAMHNKPAWSEEDEAMLDSAIAFVEHSAFTTIGKGKGGVVAWLKSLKERYTWKPSDEQMDALLWCVVHLGGADKQTLGELLEALNKL